MDQAQAQDQAQDIGQRVALNFFSASDSIVPPPPYYYPGGVAWCERDVGLLYIYHNVYFDSYRHFSRMKYIN